MCFTIFLISCATEIFTQTFVRYLKLLNNKSASMYLDYRKNEYTGAKHIRNEFLIYNVMFIGFKIKAVEVSEKKAFLSQLWN